MTTNSSHAFAWKTKDAEVYCFAIAAVLAATTLRFLAQPVFGTATPYIMYILPIMAAAAYGGFSCGLFTTILSTLVIVSVFMRGRVLSFPDAPYLFLFLLDGLYISWLGEQMRLAMRRADKAHGEAETVRDRERTILNSISDGVGALDENWQFVHANEQLARLTGVPLSGLPGKRLWDVWPEMAQDHARCELKLAFQEQVQVQLEIFVSRLNCWYEIRAYPQPRSLAIFSHDITDRKRSEQLLRESEERLRLAPEAARIGTWTFHLAQHQVTWSAELEQIFGMSPSSFAGTEDAFLDLLHPEDRLKVRDAVIQAVAHQSRFDVEFRYFHAGGETRWMLGRGSVYRDASGLPTRLLGIGIDITDQKRNEEKLRHTQRLESLGILAGGIAHDFNNLLLGITGNAGLALDSLPAGHPARNQLQEVSFAAEKASSLTRQMLAYAGKGSFVVEPLELSTLIRDTERLVRSSIPKHIDLCLDLQPGLPRMAGDPGQMQQVIMNLVINAAEAIPADQPGKILVRTSVQALQAPAAAMLSAEQFAPGDFLVLEVCDTGTGMDEATLARIFEPFFTTKYIGRGLGLSAMLGIVRNHKGFLKVTSSPGEGSTFQVLIPAVSEARAVTLAGVEKPSSPGVGSVLVVDDESAVRDFTQAVLRRCGYKVLAAEDAFGAIELLHRTPHTVSLVILDLSMPGMSARDAVDGIHRCWPGTRIMLSSGYGENEVLSKFPGMRLAGYIPKPYTPAQLVEKVKGALGKEEVAGLDLNPSVNSAAPPAVARESELAVSSWPLVRAS